MKITQLTPGTGNFHCGACIRDLALTKALRDLGHDAALMPLYLPLIADEVPEGVETEHVHFGGINAYLQHKSALFRHTPRFVDNMFDAPWLLRKAAKRAGMTDAHQLGEMTHSMLKGEHGHQSKEIRKLADALAGEHRPDVLCLSNVLLAGMAKKLKDTLGVPVVCTLQGEDTFIDSLPDPWRERSWELITACCKQVDYFFPVSRYHGDLMRARLDLDPDKISVVHNGIDPAIYIDTPARPADPPVIGYLARLCPAKGLHTLIDAFITLRKEHPDTDCRLHIAGAATPADEPYIAEQRSKLEQAGLSGVVDITPNINQEQKLAMLGSLTVLSVPATYGESFGLYVIEANAMGVPVVQPDHGAFPEVIGETGGGILYALDEPGDLVNKLKAVLNDKTLHEQLSRAGRARVLEHFTASRMASQIADTLETICPAALR